MTYIHLIDCLKCQVSANVISHFAEPDYYSRRTMAVQYDDDDGGVRNVGVVLDVLESGLTLVWADFFIHAFYLVGLHTKTCQSPSFVNRSRNQLVHRQIACLLLFINELILNLITPFSAIVVVFARKYAIVKNIHPMGFSATCRMLMVIVFLMN